MNFQQGLGQPPGAPAGQHGGRCVSSIEPCLLIPIYNHGDHIGKTVARLAIHGLPIFIVDDGSDAPTQQVLAALATKQPLVRLLRLACNQGKGAAVVHGLLAARQAGFSHALQIDADGQHDTADVPRFIACGAAQPEAVICGQPIYDASVPKGRLYGRYLTHVWVWIETLSFAIADSLCGFRLYPLASTCALIASVDLPKRMDFDTAIAVRLAWRGVAFVNLPTRVTYPVGGLSHFDMLGDNLRITRMHTRLVLGMLLRLPLLLWRKLTGPPIHMPAAAPDQPHERAAHWSRLVERGGALGLRLLFACYRLLGQRFTRALLVPVVGYFFLASGRARAASRQYLSRLRAVQGDARAPSWRDSFAHLMAFAQAGLDKLVAWSGGFDQASVSFSNQAEFERLLASGCGAVLIGSHLGNLEMTRALATSAQRARVNAVVYSDHAQRFHHMLAQANANYGVNLLQVSQFGPDTAIVLREKIDSGELLVIVGDRTPPAENGRVCQVQFLGHDAPFAQGPFILASLLACPVYLFFCLRQSDGRYHIHFELFAQRLELPRSQRQDSLQAHVQRYAQRLEAHCLLAPEQWFNFYDFWRQAEAPSATPSASPTRTPS